MSSSTKSPFWKPGERHPSKLSDKKKKKKRRRKSKGKQSSSEVREPQRRESDVKAGPSLTGKKRERKEDRGEPDVSGAVFNSVPSRSNDFYIKKSAVGGESSAKDNPAKRPKFSESLRKLKFMSRKNKVVDKKPVSERWVLPAEAKSVSEGSREELIVCVPLESRPTASSRYGRKSFKSFNRNVDSFNDSLDTAKGDRKVAAYVDTNAIDREEMSQFQQKMRAKR